MLSLTLRTHPDVLFAHSSNSIELILNAENQGGPLCWAEADVILPDTLSLGPDTNLRKGRLRLGILKKDQKNEKTTKVHASSFTKPQMYRCKVILFSYDKEGVIASRLEKTVDIRCEMKKESVL
jgi:hypothetical protein